ncbi:MAG: TetR/AcrR family transcriptional regulator [Lachnospiraceae bacterium]|nr:TetR/AcrR family transcriptional regulator [Lachnospiraceae bacterium]
MNDKFYALPEEKQERILNAGFRVFSSNSYKKSPMNEIALEAGISKSLLFFYFKNKKDFYLFLMKKAESLTQQYLINSGCYQETDIFEMMYKGLLAKAEMMKKYPDMSNFALRAYYEEDPEVKDELRKIIEPYTELKSNTTIPPLNPDDYKEGLDLQLMYQDMYLASEGYIYRMQHKGEINVEKVVEDYRRIIEFWKGLYLR